MHPMVVGVHPQRGQQLAFLRPEVTEQSINTMCGRYLEMTPGSSIANVTSIW